MAQKEANHPIEDSYRTIRNSTKAYDRKKPGTRASDTEPPKKKEFEWDPPTVALVKRFRQKKIYLIASIAAHVVFDLFQLIIGLRSHVFAKKRYTILPLSQHTSSTLLVIIELRSNVFAKKRYTLLPLSQHTSSTLLAYNRVTVKRFR